MQHALSIRHYIIAVITLFALMSCGGKKGELRIQGEIKGLNSADLTIYSRDGIFVGIDTLHVRQGKIDWSCPCDKESGTITIVYPTYSTLTIFGGSGEVIKISGDAKQLNSTRVHGTPDNEAYTALREQLGNARPESRDSITQAFIASHPESHVSRYLQLDRLATQKPAALRNGTALPEFMLVTRKGDTLTIDSLSGKHTLITFWANWKGDAGAVNGRVRRLRHQMGKAVECISYNMDVNANVLDYIEKNDSITWHSYADQKVFQSPLASRLGIRDIPYFVLTDTLCRIIASGKDWSKDIAPVLETIVPAVQEQGK